MLLLLGLQILSLGGYQLLQREENVDAATILAIELFTLAFLLLYILPWHRYSKINKIILFNKGKLSSLTNLLIFVSIPPFIIFSYMVIQLYSQGFDIHSFKYEVDVGRNFRQSLSINRYVFGLSILIVNISYFLIPLHLHFLSVNKKILSFSLFILSLNPVIFGLTYFSRAVIIHYAFVYLFFIVLLYHVFEPQKKAIIRKAFLISSVIGSFYFLSITFERFEDHYYYIDRIAEDSIFYGNVPLYSLVDYLSQWYYHNLELLSIYQFETFEGGISLHRIKSMLSELSIISYDYNDIRDTRREIWPDHAATFNGLVAYSVYDYGYLFAIILSFCYFFYVHLTSPKRIGSTKPIHMVKLFELAVLIQIPLLSIFYSVVSSIIIPLILLFLVKLYIKVHLALK